MSSLPESIKALKIQENKTAAVVTLPLSTHEKVQHLPEDEVLIRVRAVGLNPTDWQSAFADWGAPGHTLGCDAAGDVIAVGSAVKHLKVGQRVGAFDAGGSWEDHGLFAEYARVVAAACFALPPDMTYEEGASIPVAQFTSVQALYMRLPLPKPYTPEAVELKAKGERILIWGGSTACGHHAVQLAALSGLEVYVTASPAAHDDIRGLGASRVFDYKDPDIVSKVQAAAGEKGVIYALDCISEKGSTEATIDAISRARGGKVMALHPVTDALRARRQDVDVDANLAGTMIGREIVVVNKYPQPVMLEDKTRLEEWCINDIPRLFDGWKAGVGSAVYKPQRLRQISGGFDGILEGLKIMQKGAYGREKLVCRIA
ncbi:unnamed protein product [Peniophora sp. CBMAI 1063]|nr:unnamed protein product [Peniophora sp. CBMAI 1063]